MRYLGVIFYDADRVKEASSVTDPKEIYNKLMEVICDPNDPQVVTAAKEAGIPPRWIRAAQDSPSYRLIREWRLAFPLHPEYRTLPNIWYVPPLSPIARRVEEEVFFPGAAEMRIPVAYLAQLLTAGDTAAIERVLHVMLELRAVMRAKQTGDAVPESLAFPIETYDAMYRLLGLAKRRDRFNIPAGVAGVADEKLRELQGTTGYACPGGCC
jgi:nitrate reductase